MATNCSTAARARRLSDLLKEQQEPFLLLHLLLLQDHHDDDDDSGTPARTPAAASARTRNLLRGSTAATVTKLALRWADDLLAGCFSFSCAAARQTRFRRLPRADHGGTVAPADRHDAGAAGECCVRQQLSPVSVLDLHSDDDDSSPVPSHRDEYSDDDGNGKPSTAGTGTSPPSIHDHDHNLPGKIPATEERFLQGKRVASSWEWETVAADISRIPSLVELDLSGSPRDDWRRLVGGGGGGEEEARQVAQSIEAMIFEEVRWEAVRDMLSLRQH